MKSVAAIVVCCTLAFGTAFADDRNVAADDAVTAGLSIGRLGRIDALLRGYVEEKRLPGAVFAVSRRGQTAYLQTVGDYAPDSVFRIFSMTKPVTVVAVLALYEEGAFLLSDPVARYLPEFANTDVYAGKHHETGQPVTRPASQPITIEHLLTHTAGLSYDDSVEGVPKLYSQADIWSATSLQEFTARVAALPLASDPGTKWHYSVAMDVLGRLVEVVSGQAFDDFLSERIFNPLDMSDTGFHVRDDQLSRFLPLYSRDGESMQLSESPADSRYRNPDRVPYGGGGLVSTAADYMRFAQMLLNDGTLDGTRILGRKTVELMRMDHLGGNAGGIVLDEAWVGRTENRRADTNLGLGFGYGVYVITDVARNAVPGSVGTYAWGGWANTYFFVDPQEELAGLFLSQLTPSDAYPLRAQFRGLVYQAIVD